MRMFPTDSSQQQAAESRPGGSARDSLTKHNAGVFNDSVFRKISDPHEVSRSPATSWSPPSMRGKSTSKATLAIFIFIVAALALTSLCIKMRTKAVGAGPSQRRLAGSGEGEGAEDEELNNILEQCLDMEQDYLLSSAIGIQPDTSPFALPTGETATFTGPMHAASQIVPPFLLGLTAEEESFTPPMQSSDSSSSLFPGSPSHVLSPGAWLEDIPHILTEPESIDEVIEKSQDESVEGEESPQDDEQASTSAAATAEVAVRSVPSPYLHQPDMHPFIRLPAVPTGLFVEPVDPLVLDPEATTSFVSRGLLGLMRELLAKPMLTPTDARALMETSAYLVSFAEARLKKDLFEPHTAHLIRHAGLFFMVVDAVVCAYRVVGLQPATFRWWNKFIESFPGQLDIRKPRKSSRKSIAFNYKLIKGIAEALEVYKTGARPPGELVLKLKRMLLCTPHSQAYFRAARWDPWREDDKKYRESHVESSDESTEEDDEADESE